MIKTFNEHKSAKKKSEKLLCDKIGNQPLQILKKIVK